MSWKTFSLRRKANVPSSPEVLRPSERGKSLKRGDDKRIMLMNMVKEGKLTVDTAMHKAYGMGIASIPYEEMEEEEDTALGDKRNSGEIYNFGVYKYGKNNKSVKCILQIDCQEESLCLLQHGQKQKTYSFPSVTNVDTGSDTTSLTVQFDDATEIEVDAGTYEEKNRISRLLQMIVDPIGYGFPIHSDSFVEQRSEVLKEGLLEKKGHSAGFLMWPKRHVKIYPREMMYFKPGEEHNESAALSIISLKNDLFIKKIENNGFILVTDKKEYTFRVFGYRHAEQSEKERDDWIMAIQEAAKPRLDRNSEEPVIATPFEQEQYLKSVVRSLNEELEQLGVMLNIIDAPIRASTQVKKVREIVHSLNDQIQTGLLSWALRNANANVPKGDSASIKSRSLPTPGKEGGNDYDEYPEGDYREYYNQYYPQAMHEENTPDYYNQFYREPCMESPNVEINRVKQPQHVASSSHHQHSYHTYANQETYSHLEGSFQPVHKKREVESGYNMLNLSNMSPREVEMFPRYVPKPENYEDPIQKPVPVEDANFPCYAKVNKKVKQTKTSPYYNLPSTETNDVSTPPLPPKHYEQNAVKSNENKLKVESGDKIKSNEGAILDPANDYATNDDKVGAGAPQPPPPPPPPPPAPGMVTVSALPVKADFTPSCKMKPLFWSKVPDMQINSSIWKDVRDKIDGFDTSKLEELFFLGKQQNTQQEKQQKEVNNSQKISQKSLLGSKKAQNFGIFLSGFKMTDADIEMKLEMLDENEGLTSEQIASLKRFQPTTEEIEIFKSFTGDVKMLPGIDQFMMRLCKIPHLSSRLDILLTVRDLPDQLAAIEPSLKNFVSACKELQKNEKFVRLLQNVLAVGNYINAGTSRGRAYGFRLSALVKLVDIRSADKKHTVLQYLVEQLYEIDQDCLYCYKDMTALLLPFDASIKGLVAEVEIMKKDLAKVLKEIEVVSKVLASSFVEQVKSFANEYTLKIETLDAYCNEIQTHSMSLKKKFGESPSSDFESWLNHVSDFMKQLQRAVESVEHKQKRLTKRLSQQVPLNNTEVEAVVQSVSAQPNPPPLSHSSNDNEVKSVKAPISSGFISDPYESVVTHTTKQKEEVKGLSPSPSKVFTLNKATVIELNQADMLDFRSDGDSDEFSFPLKRGYLEKLSGGKRRHHKWDTRFFEVTPSGYLHYSKKQDGKLSGAIYLRGSPVCIDQHDNCILLIKQEAREWRLRADNDLVILDWYNVLIYYAQMDEIEV